MKAASSSRTNLAGSALLALVVLFLYGPLIVLIGNSFNASKYGGRWAGFTTHWYVDLVKDGATLSALGNTLLVATVAGVGATILGSVAAWSIHHFKSPLQRLHLLLTQLPMVVPDMWIGVAMQVFLIQVAWSLSLGTVMIAHVTFCVCYVTALMLGRMQSFDFSVIEAARDLGASWSQVVLRVVLPLLGPSMVAAFILSLLLSIDDFVITFFVSGPGSSTLPNRVFSMAKTSRSFPVINALSTLLIFATLVLTLLGNRLIRPNANPKNVPVSE
ncbi:MAG: ABC transporter permease [Verrucomicrobiaceae bacterium]|nr:ABC transporter permease [Verrucomicrobiaceae bacterium]